MGESDYQRSSGIAAWNRIEDEVRRFAGCGLLTPWRVRTRWLVDGVA